MKCTREGQDRQEGDQEVRRHGRKEYDAAIEERNKREEAERTERLGKDKEEAIKLLRRRRADAAASVAASVCG